MTYDGVRKHSSDHTKRSTRKRVTVILIFVFVTPRSVAIVFRDGSTIVSLKDFICLWDYSQYIAVAIGEKMEAKDAVITTILFDLTDKIL
jgi:hypothetical protein